MNEDEMNPPSSSDSSTACVLAMTRWPFVDAGFAPIIFLRVTGEPNATITKGNQRRKSIGKGADHVSRNTKTDKRSIDETGTSMDERFGDGSLRLTRLRSLSLYIDDPAAMKRC